MFTERGSEMDMFPWTCIETKGVRQPPIKAEEVFPLEMMKDFEVQPDPEPNPLRGFSIREPRESFHHKRKAFERIAKRAGLTCVQREVLFQHILRGVPLNEVRLETCGVMYSEQCVRLALGVAKDAIRASRTN